MFTWKTKNKLWKGEGIYHLTFSISGRQPLFGRLAETNNGAYQPIMGASSPALPHREGAKEAAISSHAAQSPAAAVNNPALQSPAAAVNSHAVATARIELTELGYRVSEDLNHFSTRHPGTQICAKQIMPDHLHVVIWVKEDAGKSIKRLAHGFRKGITDIAVSLGVWGKDGAYQPLMGASPPALPHREGAKEAAISSHATQSPAAAVSSLPAGAGSIAGISKSGFILSEPYIRTLAHKGQLRSMIDYVHSNPSRAMAKRLNPQLFTLHRETCIAGLSFSSMGNHWLLDWPIKQMIQCSRSISQYSLNEKLNACLAAAESGVVSYTAAISKGEQQIARALREAGHPLVILLKDGFPPEGSEHERYFKPGGIYFEACANGKLLLLEPTSATYASKLVIDETEATLHSKAEAKHQIYTPIPHSTDRWRFMAGNEILGIISGLTSL